MTQKSDPKHAEKIIVHVDPELEDLIPDFLGNRHKDIETLQEALAKGDYETIQKLGHTMKGIGGGYGFDSITDIGAALENVAKDKNNEEIRKLVGELLHYLERAGVVFE